MPGTECQLVSGPLDDALSSPVKHRQEMPPRVSLDTSPRASRKAISEIHQTGGERPTADNSFTSALDVPPLRRPAALRRRGSDGDSPRYRDSSSHRGEYPSMDNSPTEPHPLRRASSTTVRTARYETTGSTRPRLSRILSPSTPVLARPPSPGDFPALPDRAAAESHRTVLAHEVGNPFLLILILIATFPFFPFPFHLFFFLPTRQNKKDGFPDPLRYLPLSRSRQRILSQASP